MALSFTREFRRVALTLLVVGASAPPAAAQFRPPADPAIGERYHIEAAANWWNATPTLIISSESLGIQGDEVDLITDLGIEQKRLPELRLVLRPARKHKFRFNYVPITYDAEAIVRREFVFNGQRYRIGLPVNTTADLTTFRMGYEYDFVYLDRGFVGALIDLKYTNINVRLNSAIGAEFLEAVAPIPTFGLVGRAYVAPNIAITGEFTYFNVPDNLARGEFDGRYLDFDFYGTVNFNGNVGAQIGYRSIDVRYFSQSDAGNLTFKGMYFGGTLRF